MDNNNNGRDVKGLLAVRGAFRKLKSVLIMFLVALAIYQTGQLWFVHLANRNFFLFLTARINPSISEGYREFVRPSRMIYGSGNGRFEVRYRELMDANNPPRGYFDAVMTELFVDGRFISKFETDYVSLLARPVLMYEYAFPMRGEIFPLGFGQRTGQFLTGRGIDTFSSVAIWPPYDDDVRLRVFFMLDGYSWEFVLDSVSEALSFPITHVSAANLHHVSAGLEGYEYLPPQVFVARPGGLGWVASFPVTVANPYLDHIGERQIQFIRRQVRHFFDNPAAITDRIAADGVWTFSTNHVTVRYYDTDVVEFASFRPRPRNATSSFIEDFSVAWGFIADDYHVINEVYLMGYEARGAGYVFWFGYIVDNFPVIMPPEGWPVSSYEDILPAPIEVIVEQGRITRYRRLAHNFHFDMDVEYGNRRIDFDLDTLLYGRDDNIANLVVGYPMRHTGPLWKEWIVSEICPTGEGGMD